MPPAPESTARAVEQADAYRSFTREEVQRLVRQFTMQASHFDSELSLVKRLKAESLRQHQRL